MRHLHVFIMIILIFAALYVNAAEEVVVTVTHVGDDTLVLDAGSSKGLRTGLRGRVYYKLTIGSEVRNIHIAKIVLTTVDTNISMAKVEAKTKDLEPGLLVEIEGIQTSMVLIPAGDFSMGDHHNAGEANEKPVHTVYVEAFYIDRYEVTNAQYRRFVQETGHGEPEGLGYVNGKWQRGFKPWSDSSFNDDDQPVVCVSWLDAQAYAKWAGKRLPTEAEWEKAARGGLIGKKYPWGDASVDGSRCNFADHNTDFSWSDKKADDGYARTSPIGSFSPNGYGLYDMSGNVLEWCSDRYAKDYYSRSPARNPRGPSSGSGCVFRGGSWDLYASVLRCANRDYGNPATTSFNIGFRCAQ